MIAVIVVGLMMVCMCGSLSLGIWLHQREESLWWTQYRKDFPES